MKKIYEWKYILLDTSFIVDYFSDPSKLEKNPTKKENAELAKSIIELLSSDKRKEAPLFYVTSITIGELWKLETGIMAKKIIEALHAGDVTIMPYGKAEAEILSKTVLSWRKIKEPNTTYKKLEEECKKNGCANFRSWISDDMKILSCAKLLYNMSKLDVILTSDKNTFLPIADFMNLPCQILTKENFPINLFGELSYD